jgi:hypothetical protein
MLGSFGKSQPSPRALERVRDWTRDRFGLEDTLLVTEVVCSQPGCPPLETVVAFWTQGARRHHFKIFKPVGEVQPDDLPYAWMKDGLHVPEGFSCDCC